MKSETLPAKYFADEFSLGIYDAHIKLKGAPVLEELEQMEDEHPGITDKVIVGELAKQKQIPGLICLRPRMRVSEVIEVLRSTRVNGFPITNSIPSSPMEGIVLEGSISRGQVSKILQHKMGIIPSTDSSYGVPEDEEKQADFLADLAERPFRPLKIDPAANELEKALTMEDRNLIVDFTPFMKLHPFVVGSDSCLRRVYRLFRSMGLRHIFITEQRPVVTGILTRKDIIGENAVRFLHD